MRPRGVYPHECPNCRALLAVGVEEAVAWWFADSRWQCPHCEHVYQQSDLTPNKKPQETPT